MEARGFPVYAFAYPDGAYGEREVSLVREAGFPCALGVDLGFNSGRTDRFRLKRFCMNDRGGLSEALVKASGLWGVFRMLLGRDRFPRPYPTLIRWFEPVGSSVRRRARGEIRSGVPPRNGTAAPHPPSEKEEAWSP